MEKLERQAAINDQINESVKQEEQRVIDAANRRMAEVHAKKAEEEKDIKTNRIWLALEAELELANPGALKELRERLDLLNSLRQSDALPALMAVVQRAARLAEKGDLGETVLTVSAVVTAERFESPSEKAMHDVLGQLEPLAAGRRYRDLAEALVQATPVLEAFFDGDDSVMVMADDAELRRNRLNLLGVLRNQAAVLARFDLIQI